MTWLMLFIGVVMGLGNIAWFEFRRADCLGVAPFEGFNYTWEDALVARQCIGSVFDG